MSLRPYVVPPWGSVGLDHRRRAAHLDTMLRELQLRARPALGWHVLRYEAGGASVRGLSRVSRARLAVAQARRRTCVDPDPAATAVVLRVGALHDAVARGAGTRWRGVASLLRMHHAVMLGHPRAGGLRAGPVWIGGTGLDDCRYLPPPAAAVAELLTRLWPGIEDDALPATLRAGLVYAALTSIHPFLDGNGRTSRALAHVVLQRGGASVVSPAVGAAFTGVHAQAHADALSGYQQGELQPWLSLWLDLMASALARLAALVDAFGELAGQLLADTHDPLAALVRDELLARPVSVLRPTAHRLGCSVRRLEAVLDTLARRGVITTRPGPGGTVQWGCPAALAALACFDQPLALRPREPGPHDLPLDSRGRRRTLCP
ncbi:MAG: Fic family protein [Deltaproteobacteria bacterium]|nr:Fic family protein [Deltaproteobacteria bacterium]